MTDLAAKALDWSRATVAPRLTGHSHTPESLRECLRSAAKLGLLGIQVARRHGGMGLGFGDKVRVAEALARVDFGTAMAVLNSHNVAEQIARLGRAELTERHAENIVRGELVACTALTEPNMGSDFAAIETRATRTADGWQLDGNKTWIINACHADAVVVYAQTQADGGAAGIGAFWVMSDQAGFVRDSTSPMGPIPTMGVGSFQLKGYRCSPQDLISPPGEAFKDILHAINGARTYVAAMCCGMVEECLQVAAAYGHRRQTFGKPLVGHQGWRWVLAEASVDLQAARLLVARATDDIDANADAQVSAAQAKVFATRMAHTHMAALMHAMGAEGLHDRHAFLRHLQAVQAAALTDGSTEMLLERIARSASAPVSISTSSQS